ncbi:MAG: protein kinase [Clostridia bacterium]|nr:protein kinase [Clostridia bacterium]
MDGKRIPTMPQGDDNGRIPTVPQGSDDSRIPTMPQDSERIATMPQDSADGRIATVPQDTTADGRVATVPQGETVSAGGKKGQLIFGSIPFSTPNGNYIINASDIVNLDSGESQIYGCKKDGDDTKYIARVLVSVTPSSSYEKLRTREKVLDFLRSVSGDENSHILPLIDTAEISVGAEKRFVEVYPFCEEGDLEKKKGTLSYDYIKNEIVPAVNEALKRFHAAKLVHRDIKPENLYSYKGKIVIADFGITCDLREDGFAIDRQKTGTLGYYAPELMSQAAIIASDYYSLGQTLWTLYSGEMMYKYIFRQYRDVEEQRNQINIAMMNGIYSGLDEIQKGEEFFEILIRGLLQYDPRKRFDYEKVQRWLMGDKSLTNELSDFHDDNTFNRALKICNTECWDSTEIYKVLCNNWTEGKDLLYSGALKDFYLAQNNYEMGRFFDGIMKQYAYSANESEIEYLNNLGLSKVILQLSNSEVLCWMGEKFASLEDISVFAYSFFEQGFRKDIIPKGFFTTLIKSELLIEWCQSNNKSQEIIDLLSEIIKVFRTSNKGQKVAVAWLSFVFLSDKEKVQFNGCRNMNELQKMMLSTAKSMYLMTDEIPMVESYGFLAFLCALGYQDFANLYIKDTAGVSLAEQYDNLYDFFYSVGDNEIKEMVKKHYYNYGPKAYYIWLRNNLGLYNFVGSKAQSLKTRMEALSVKETDALATQREFILKMENAYAEFSSLDISDVFLSEIGFNVTRKNSYIRAKKLSAVWSYSFLGNIAPIGYKYVLGM